MESFDAPIEIEKVEDIDDPYVQELVKEVDDQIEEEVEQIDQKENYMDDKLEECVVDLKESSISTDECITTVTMEQPKKRGFFKRLFKRENQDPDVIIHNSSMPGSAKKIA